MSATNKIVQNLVNIILPAICLGCKKEDGYLCEECTQNLNTYKYFVCPACRRRDEYGALDKKCRKKSGLTKYFGAPLPYQDELARQLIHSFKYLRAKSIAKLLSQILIEFLDRNNFGEIIKPRKKQMIIVPVPLYNFKERERGFNQAAVIARYVAGYYKIDINEKVLKKHKNTEQQADIGDKEKRLQNISRSFSTSKNSGQILKNKIVILIDDVYTSGATMRECVLALCTAGAREVWGMTAARG